ncbi:Plasmodium exported protein, unknown function [Plasmodium vivax]|uniref:Uncharacterized protein n=1 Tax=Plasmodium vivax TaxID=5855 RepID=A0A565A5Z3_PLAVI|nr:Plasmodium exported protein, unknown function [Plasmodium vivax]
MNKLNIMFLFNVVSLSFLIWISPSGNHGGNIHKYINMKQSMGNTWNVRNERLLTNDDVDSKIGQSGQRDNLKIPEENILKSITESAKIFEQINKDRSNNMYSYRNKLKYGYANKKGLKRLDCQYEKKLFDEMDKLDKISEHMNRKNSYFKKVIWKRYRFLFMLFVLIMIFGITSSSICCAHIGENNNNQKHLESCVFSLNAIFYTPLIIAFISFIIYIFRKVRKYKRLKREYKNSEI